MAKASSEITVEVGQRVNYVMADGQIRPMDVVRVHDKVTELPGVCNGILLVDGINDSENIPGASVLPMLTRTFSPHTETPVCSLWVTMTHYDDTRTPGTYHFGEEDAGEGFEKSVLQEQIDDLRKQIKALTPKKPKAEKVTEMPTPA